MTTQTFDPQMFECMLTQPEEKTMIPEHARAYLEIIGRLGPIFYQADQRSAEEYEQSIAPHVKEFLMDLKGKDYLPASARIAWFNEIYKFGFIFGFIFKVEEVEVEKEVPVEPGNPRNTQKKKILVKARKYQAGCVIFTGTGKIGLGDKEVCDADFAMALEKAITGAKSRACADIGLGTREAYAQDDKVLSDTPIEGKSLMEQVGASNGKTPGNDDGDSLTGIQRAKLIELYGKLEQEVPDDLADYCMSLAAKEIQRLSAEYQRVKAPIKGSIAVTTQATVEAHPNGKIDVNGIRMQIAMINGPLIQPERFQIIQYLSFKGIPIHQNAWKPADYPVALQAMKDWLLPVESPQARPTKEQVERINGYANTMNKIHLQQTCIRLCGVTTSNKLNTTRMGYLLGVLAQGIMLYELTNQVDPEFTLIKSFGCDSPFDLLYADPEKQSHSWQEYEVVLRAHAQGKTISEPFLAKYEKEYADFSQE